VRVYVCAFLCGVVEKRKAVQLNGISPVVACDCVSARNARLQFDVQSPLRLDGAAVAGLPPQGFYLDGLRKRSCFECVSE